MQGASCKDLCDLCFLCFSAAYMYGACCSFFAIMGFKKTFLVQFAFCLVFTGLAFFIRFFFVSLPIIWACLSSFDQRVTRRSESDALAVVSSTSFLSLAIAFAEPPWNELLEPDLSAGVSPGAAESPTACPTKNTQAQSALVNQICFQSVPAN